MPNTQPNYYIVLFSPDTYAAFRSHGATVTGFRARQQRVAQGIEPGDVLLGYLTRLSRWCAVLPVLSKAFLDSTPIFGDPDEFNVRLRVEPRTLLEPEQALPVFEEEVWSRLSFTRSLPHRSPAWTGVVRSSLYRLSEEDGRSLVALLEKQAVDGYLYPLTERDRQQMSRRRVIATPMRDVFVEIPAKEEEPELPAGKVFPAAQTPDEDAPRRSIEIQAKVATIGARMGFKVWVPPSDRGRIAELMPPQSRAALLSDLRLNYEDATLGTVRQIDVLWLQQNAMTRAFEIEHTTSIYSGLLRMADLFALQPNMRINAHIVAPAERRDKVMKEIKRPVFSTLAGGPLYDSCTYLSYEDVEEIAGQPHLEHVRHTFIDEWAEKATEEE